MSDQKKRAAPDHVWRQWKCNPMRGKKEVPVEPSAESSLREIRAELEDEYVQRYNRDCLPQKCRR